MSIFEISLSLSPFLTLSLFFSPPFLFPYLQLPLPSFLFFPLPLSLSSCLLPSHPPLSK